MFKVWVEHFPLDFDDPPKYMSLNRILGFVKSDMKNSYGDELEKKIKHRLDKFQITPYEDEGETPKKIYYFVKKLTTVSCEKSN